MSIALGVNCAAFTVKRAPKSTKATTKDCMT